MFTGDIQSGRSGTSPTAFTRKPSCSIVSGEFVPTPSPHKIKTPHLGAFLFYGGEGVRHNGIRLNLAQSAKAIAARAIQRNIVRTRSPISDRIRLYGVGSNVGS